MTTDEVIEACKDWLKKNHNIAVPEAQGGFIRNRGHEAVQAGATLNNVEVTFIGIEKPTPYRG